MERPESRAVKAAEQEAAQRFASMHDPRYAGYTSVNVTPEVDHWIVDGVYRFNLLNETQLTAKVRQSDYSISDVWIQKDLKDQLREMARDNSE